MTAKRVMFDSNTWRQVVSPTKYPKDNRHEIYQKLNDAIKAGHIEGFISETTIAVEQIKKEDRLDWIKTSTQYLRSVDVPGMPNVAAYAIGLLPSKTIEPTAHRLVAGHLQDAAKIGMKLLRVDRAAYPESSLLRSIPDTTIRIENPKDDSLMRQLFIDFEGHHVGLANLKQLGMQHTSDAIGTHWSDGIASLDQNYTNKVAKLFGEWADGDAVAASIAHKLDVFCTLDQAKGAYGSNIQSILSEDFKVMLNQDYGIAFLSPDELLAVTHQ